eukprot:TRINITY_DN764_c1_g1_i1.p1 TRINITY_DN764_c1_g1~~TRINITY_DN764_c1_g1_i1.p1  ORF type:complete len:335 (+),score=41.22 TRINITY_DN764_c1_g1_i1:53-1057(+)
MTRSPSAGYGPVSDMEPLRSNEYYKQGGLFDEFLQLQPAQLSWGGVVSVLSSLIQSHGQCLTRLHHMESAISDLKGCMGPGVPSQVQLPPPTNLEQKLAENKASIDKLYAVMQIDEDELDRALNQAGVEGPHSHAQVKLLHGLPAFSTLIEDIKDVLVPLGDEKASPRQPSQIYQPEATGQVAKERSYIPTPAVSIPTPAQPRGGRPMVGLEIIDAVPTSSDPLSSSGVRVFAVRPDGPAAAGGVLNGDCILALNDRKVTTRSDLKEVMATCVAGDIVKVDLLRENIPDPFQVHIRLGTAPTPAPTATVQHPPSYGQKETVSPTRRTRTPTRGR